MIRYLLLFTFILSGFVQAERPNIILLFADDQRADTISAHGNRHIQTPHLDRMVNEGVSFRNNFCAGSFSGAVCVASRSMLMTGRHWTQLPVNRPAVNWGDSVLLPRYLKEQGGYDTYLVGKWHNGKKTLDQCFDNGQAIYMGGMCDHTDFEVQDLKHGTLSPKRKAQAFSSTEFANAAIDYISNAKAESPFFLYVSFTAPHDPRNPPESFREMYYNKRPPLPKNFMPQHPFMNLDKVQQGRDEGLAAWPRTEDVISDQLCEYYGLITHLDNEVGRIYSAVKESVHADNTIIIYTADHGLSMGSHGLLGKQNVYEQSMKAPLLITGPGIPRGKSIDAFNYIHDLYATICDFSGMKIPSQASSKSLKALIDGTQKKIYESIYLPFQDNQRAINDGQWKLHLYPKINHAMLFNIEKDPDELNDLISSHPKQIERMMTLLEKWREKIGDKAALKVQNPQSKEILYSNQDRVLDIWQPKWIRDKYFGGRTNPNHGKK